MSVVEPVLRGHPGDTDGVAGARGLARGSERATAPSRRLTGVSQRRSVPTIMRWVVVVILVVACSSSKKTDPGSAAGSASGAAASPAAADSPAKAPAMSKYSVMPVGETTPISVEVAIPSGWTVDSSSPDGPTFQIPGAEVRQLTINALALGGDAEARMAKAIRMQYDDAAGAERSELSGGRVWMVRRENVVDHARMFVPYDGGVVMGVAIVTHASADRLPAIKQAFETIAVAAR